MMRKEHIYECVRAWHLEESQEEVKEMIEELVPFIHYSEEELKEEGALEESDKNADAVAAVKNEDVLETATAASSEGQAEDDKQAEGKEAKEDAKAVTEA